MNDLSSNVTGGHCGRRHRRRTGAADQDRHRQPDTVRDQHLYRRDHHERRRALYLGDSVSTGKILNAVAVGSSGAFEVINADTSGITSITNDGYTNFRNNTSAGSVAITNNYGGNTGFYGTSTAGSATITNNSNLGFRNQCQCRQRYHHQPFRTLNFFNTSTGRKRRDHQQRRLLFQRRQRGRKRHHHQHLTVLNFNNSGKAGSATITNRERPDYFSNSSTAGNATISNNPSDLSF